jgi:hypothetical protein
MSEKGIKNIIQMLKHIPKKEWNTSIDIMIKMVMNNKPHKTDKD